MPQFPLLRAGLPFGDGLLISLCLSYPWEPQARFPLSLVLLTLLFPPDSHILFAFVFEWVVFGGLTQGAVLAGETEAQVCPLAWDDRMWGDRVLTGSPGWSVGCPCASVSSATKKHCILQGFILHIIT